MHWTLAGMYGRHPRRHPPSRRHPPPTPAEGWGERGGRKAGYRPPREHNWTVNNLLRNHRQGPVALDVAFLNKHKIRLDHHPPTFPALNHNNRTVAPRTLRRVLTQYPRGTLKWKMPHQEAVPPQPLGLLVWTWKRTMVRIPQLNERNNLNNLLKPLHCPLNFPTNKHPGLCPVWPLAPFGNSRTSQTYPAQLERKRMLLKLHKLRKPHNLDTATPPTPPTML